jgi:phosphatidylglycerophosphate synthase
VGGYLDIVTDFVVYAAVPLGIAAALESQGIAAWGACALLVSSFYVNAVTWLHLAALLEKRGEGAAATGERTSITMPEGLVAGSETALFYGLFLLLPAQAPRLFLVMAALVLATALHRVVVGVRWLR